MLGQKILGCRHATGSADEIFGGKSIVLFGDTG